MTQHLKTFNRQKKKSSFEDDLTDAENNRFKIDNT